MQSPDDSVVGGTLIVLSLDSEHKLFLSNLAGLAGGLNHAMRGAGQTEGWPGAIPSYRRRRNVFNCRKYCTALFPQSLL
jgi:hypothetical protein